MINMLSWGNQMINGPFDMAEPILTPFPIVKT